MKRTATHLFIWVASTLLLSVAIILSGCEQSGKDKKSTTKQEQTTALQSERELSNILLEQAIKNKVQSYDMKFFSVDEQNDITKQIKGIEDLISKGVESLIVNSLKSKALNPLTL